MTIDIPAAAETPAPLQCATQADAARLEMGTEPARPTESLLARSEQSSGMSDFGEHGTHAPESACEDVAPPRRNVAIPVVGVPAAGAAPLILGKPVGELALRTLELIAKTGTPNLKAAAITELARRAAVVSVPAPEVAKQPVEVQGTATTSLPDVPPELPPPGRVLPHESGGRLQRAVAWLRDLLCAGPTLAAEAKRGAAEAGITVRTLERAAARLGVKHARQAFAGAYTWQLPMLASSGPARQEAGADGEHDDTDPHRLDATQREMERRHAAGDRS